MDKEHRKDSHKENPDHLTNFMFGGSMSRNERKGRNDDAESSFQERNSMQMIGLSEKEAMVLIKKSKVNPPTKRCRF